MSTLLTRVPVLHTPVFTQLHPASSRGPGWAHALILQLGCQPHPHGTPEGRPRWWRGGQPDGGLRLGHPPSNRWCRPVWLCPEVNWSIHCYACWLFPCGGSGNKSSSARGVSRTGVKSDGICDLLPKCWRPKTFNMCSEPLGVSLPEREAAIGSRGLGLRHRNWLHSFQYSLRCGWTQKSIWKSGFRSQRPRIRPTHFPRGRRD